MTGDLAYEFGTAMLGFLGIVLGRVWQKNKSKVELQKLKAETKGAELDNVTKAVEIWRELSIGLQKTIDELKHEVEMLRRENTSLKADIRSLKQSINKKI